MRTWQAARTMTPPARSTTGPKRFFIDSSTTQQPDYEIRRNAAHNFFLSVFCFFLLKQAMLPLLFFSYSYSINYENAHQINQKWE